MPKAFFVDTSRCTACRGCQIACKEWYELPANETLQRGSHQNPPDLNAHNYKVVRFSEQLVDGKVNWFFFPDQCRHCAEPPCKMIADGYMDGAVIQDEKTGAVLFTEKTRKLGQDTFEEVREACPYNVPRRDEKTGAWAKCTGCQARVAKGLLPACVKACPTGAMSFGEREEMLALAEKRLAVVRKDFPRAMLADPDSVNVIYLLQDEPSLYHAFSVAQGPAGLDRKEFLARLSAPLTRTVERLMRS